MPGFLNDVEDIRQRAAQKIEEGAVTASYEGDTEQTIDILNDALATEIVCVLRYMHHYFMATGVHGMAVRDEFKEHADAEREHADKIADRIQQLGGRPDYNPASLVQRSASQYAEGNTLADMIKEDLIAERIVIEVYQRMIRHFADHDPTTRVMIEGILRDEEEHASDLSDLLFIIDPKSGKTEGEDPGTHPLDMQHDERSRQQQGKQGKQNKTIEKNAESNESRKKDSHHRELDVPATPRPDGGVKQPQQPQLSGQRNREGVGNLVSGDKTLLESPERSAPRGAKGPLRTNGKKNKKRVA
ncbi:MAG: bacterioferritin [Candidatus Korobacteraceae bacterium]|jgi:bacterioferritin